MIRDLRHGVRRLLSAPGASAAAVVSLALAIGANSAVFSLVHGVLLRPLPYPEAGRLAMLWEQDLLAETPIQTGSAPAGLLPVSVPNLMDYRARNEAFEALAGLGSWVPTLSDGDGRDAVKIEVGAVSAELFGLLRVRPALGRGFRPEEDRRGADQVVVLSHGLWRDRYAGDPGVLGRTLRLQGREFTIVGVMPPGFDFPGKPALWKPLGFGANDFLRDFNLLQAVGRLKPGITLEEAQQRMSALAASLAEQYPDTNAGRGVRLVRLEDHLSGKLRPALLALAGAVALILLIACANVSNLLLARAAARGGEVALRKALGAGRGRLVRQLLAEGLVLALPAGALGVALAWAGLAGLLPLVRGPLGRDVPGLDEVGLHPPVLLFTAAVSLLAALLSGLAPALAATRGDLAGALRAGGRGLTSGSAKLWQQGTVVAQLALALALLAGAGLLLRSFGRLLAVDPGFRSEGVVAVEVSLPWGSYAEPARTTSFFRDLEERLAALPGVQAVGASWFPPLSAQAGHVSYTVAGRAAAGEPPQAAVQAVTPGYFAALGIPLLRGRALGAGDDAGAPAVAVVNEELARRTWPGEDPVGQRIELEVDFGPAGQLARATREVVGVVGDVRHFGLDREVEPEIFFPSAQGTWRTLTLYVRGADPAAVAGAVRAFLRRRDPELAPGEVRRLEQLLAETVASRRLGTWLVALFAGTALALAAVGVYGVLAYAVGQRTPEIGLRMALGASRRDVLWLVLKAAAGLALAGVVLGLALASGLTRFLAGLLYGIGPLDGATFAAVAAALAGVALAAGYLPARRAARTDPLAAMRHE